MYPVQPHSEAITSLNGPKAHQHHCSTDVQLQSLTVSVWVSLRVWK